MTIAPSPVATPLADALDDALAHALDDDAAGLDRVCDHSPAGRRDRFATLLRIYDLHTAPLERVGAAARWQHHPAVAALKTRCETAWLDELATHAVPDELTVRDAELYGTGAVDVIRALAARDRLPEVYRWLARSADRDAVVEFLSLEGGPDAGFDDLVAACQIGLSGSAKMELATNYWDEMGDGDADAVHTTLHDHLVETMGLRRISLTDLPVSALERNALGGLLATNRWLQPEMLGALGLIELQAGPRCRLVVQAMQRCGAPANARRFYDVHADVDPRHGKDWLEKAIAPTVAEHPEWGPRIVRGAVWRSAVNASFLDDITEMLGVPVDKRTVGEGSSDADSGVVAA